MGSSLSLVTAFGLKSVLPGVSVATPASLFACFHHHNRSFPALLFQSLCVFHSEAGLLWVAYGKGLAPLSVQPPYAFFFHPQPSVCLLI